MKFNICNTKIKKKLWTRNYYILTSLISIYTIFIFSFVIYSYYQMNNLKIDSEIKEIRISYLKWELLKFKEAEENKIKKLDLETDSSITKFVTSTKSFNDKAYIPENLVNISSRYVYDAKWWIQLLKIEANEAIQKMAEAFYDEFWKKIVIVSAYRSYLYQKGIKDRGCPDNLCAKAGYSEHQSGLTFDVWEATTEKQFLSKPKLKKYFDWLSDNAYLYWFHNTYQKGLEIDGYEIEPWHWRYMWVDLATYLYKNNLTFAEFYSQKNLD